MAAPVTQKTRDQAAALVQARLRGLQQRQRDARVLKAVTTLQARQRGRYTRREYQRLLEFYNEQESFLQESKRRQRRLWHREQELYFLQHTSAQELEAIRAFQFDRSARRIQRAWRELHPAPLEDVDVSGLGVPFDPFSLGALASYGHSERPKREPGAVPRAVVLAELYGESLPRESPWTMDEQTAAKRRAEIQERLPHRRKETHKSPLPHNQPTRRELYEQLVALRHHTAQRLTATKEQFHAQRGARDLEAARLSASCRHRVAFLLDETRVRAVAHASQQNQATAKRALESQARAWRADRQQEAWTHHARVVQSVLGERKWYETTLAGEQRDIRRVYAQSPWEHAKQVWQWPRPPVTRPEHNTLGNREDLPELTAMDRFRFCLRDDDSDATPDSNNQEQHLLEQEDDTKKPMALDDALASTWWRAHATQSHTSYKTLQERRLRLLRRTKLLSFSSGRAVHGTEDAHVTPEMLANPPLYALYRRTLEDARRQRIEETVAARVAQLEHQIHQQVVAVETHVELNTRRILEERARVLQQNARQTKAARAAVEIQRVARGRRGRKQAQDHLAAFFVLVRGRAIRKGKCEECGEQPAVLECRQCEESLHFCPTCWVQVHATRRRKTHVAIPMAVSGRFKGAPAADCKETRTTTTRPAESQPPQLRSTAALVLSPPREASPQSTTGRSSERDRGVDGAALPPPSQAREPRQDTAETMRTRAACVEPLVEKTGYEQDASPQAVDTDRRHVSAKAPRPTSATTAKPKKATDAPATPQMSLRERMAAGTQPHQHQQQQEEPRPVTAMEVELLAVPRAETTPSAAAAETLTPLNSGVEDDQPPRGRPPGLVALNEQAARTIQALRRRYLAQQSGLNDTDPPTTS